MKINPLYQRVSINSLDMEDLSFSLTPTGPEIISDELRRSISSCGLIQPPFLLAKNAGRPLIVTGRERISAATELLGEKFCNCLVLPADTEPAILLTIALQDILLRRPTTLMEKAICWQKAVNSLGLEIATEKFAALLGMNRQLTTVKLAKIMNFNGEMQKSLHLGGLDPKAALKLLDLARTDQEALFSVFTGLGLSSSNQKKLIDQGLELSNRLNKPIAEILAEPECLELINHPEANPPQKTTMLMNWLRGKCFPGLTAAEKEFRTLVGRLALPSEVTIDHSASFEKDTLKLRIDFRDRQHLLTVWPLLRKVLLTKGAE